MSVPNMVENTLRQAIVDGVLVGGQKLGQFELASAIQLLQRSRRRETVAPARRTKKPYALADHEALVCELIASRPDMIVDEQTRLNPERLVFIDETWATTNMTRLSGRAPRGQRLVAAVPHGH
jgi:hypothetical protein